MTRHNTPFRKAYGEAVGLILRDPVLRKKIEIIALLGSVAQNEAVEEWSDLDILLVSQCDQYGNIGRVCIDSIKGIAEVISVHYQFPVSFSVHTEDDLRNYVSFEYLVHYSFGECTYPASNALSNLISQILDQRDVPIRIRKRYCLYHLRHIRFNLIRHYVSINKFKTKSPLKDFAKLLIDQMLKIVDLYLNSLDLWPRTKEEIVNYAHGRLKVNLEPLSKALYIRKEWQTVSDKELSEFVQIGLAFVDSVMEFVLTEQSDSTPEELIAL